MILQDLYPVHEDDGSLLDVIGAILESLSEIEENQLLEIKTKLKKYITNIGEMEVPAIIGRAVCNG